MFSIIVPIYNGKEHISRCVNSILSQSYPNFELLIIDDGSTDGSAKICDEYAQKDSRIRVIHQKNAGVSSARNLGIKEAVGKWLTFLDVDDEFASYTLEYISSLINNDIDAINCEVITAKKFSYTTCSPLSSNFFILSNPTEIIDKTLVNPTKYLTCHGWFLRTDVFINNDIFFNTKLCMGEDGEMMIRYLQKIKNVCFSETVIYRYSINLSSTIHGWKKGVTENYIKTITEVQNAVGDYSDGLVAYTLVHLLLILTHDTFHSGNGLSLYHQIKNCKGLLDMDLFKNAFNKVDLSMFDFTKRATLFCLKHKLIFPAWIAVKVRQAQNASRAS